MTNNIYEYFHLLSSTISKAESAVSDLYYCVRSHEDPSVVLFAFELSLKLNQYNAIVIEPEQRPDFGLTKHESYKRIIHLMEDSREILARNKDVMDFHNLVIESFNSWSKLVNPITFFVRQVYLTSDIVYHYRPVSPDLPLTAEESKVRTQLLGLLETSFIQFIKNEDHKVRDSLLAAFAYFDEHKENYDDSVSLAFSQLEAQLILSGLEERERNV